MDTLAERLAALINEINTKPAKLSLEMGHNSNYISHILKGKNANPRQPFYEYLEVRYNASPHWLKAGEGDMFLKGGKKNDISNANWIKTVNSFPPEERKIVFAIITALKCQIETRENK